MNLTPEQIEGLKQYRLQMTELVNQVKADYAKKYEQQKEARQKDKTNPKKIKY